MTKTKRRNWQVYASIMIFWGFPPWDVSSQQHHNTGACHLVLRGVTDATWCYQCYVVLHWYNVTYFRTLLKVVVSWSCWISCCWDWRTRDTACWYSPRWSGCWTYWQSIYRTGDSSSRYEYAHRALYLGPGIHGKSRFWGIHGKCGLRGIHGKCGSWGDIGKSWIREFSATFLSNVLLNMILKNLYMCEY